MPMNDAAKRLMILTLQLKAMRFQFIRNLWSRLTHVVASMKSFPRITVNRRKSAYSRFYRTRIQCLEERRLLTGAIAGRLWLDADYDGVQDTSETQNFANISVKLERSGSPTLTALTNANGRYAFDVLAGTGYHLSFILPAGFTLSPDLVSNSFKTFTANTNSTYTNYFTVTDGTTQQYDGGLIQGGTLTVFCWNDADGDGFQDAGAPEQNGLAGATVTLAGSQYAQISATTGTNGMAVFANVRPGTFHINAYRSGYNRTLQNAGLDDTRDSDVDVATGNSSDFLVAPSSNITDVDAGFVDPALGSGTISGKAWLDNGDGIRQIGETSLTGTYYFDLYQTTDNIVGNADDQYVSNDATDSNRIYEFINVAPGKYYVKVNPGMGYVMAPQSQGADTTINSDFSPATFYTGLLNVVAGGAIKDIDAGLVLGSASIGNHVWNDLDADGIQEAGESGLAGVRVQLYTSTNTLVGSEIVTDATGNYLFTNLTPGQYYVQFVPPASYLTSPKDQGTNDALDSDIDPLTMRTAIVTVTVAQSLKWDAGFYLGATIGDRAWNDTNRNGIQDTGEANLANVAVRLYGSTGQLLRSTITNASGAYSFVAIETGQYFLGITPPTGYLQSPRDVSSNAIDTLDNDFDPVTHTTILFNVTRGTTQNTWDAGFFLGATVGDRVWLDTNANGRQDVGELGKSGVGVKLKSAGLDGRVGTTDDVIVAQTSTNTSGLYSFVGIDNGAYYVEFARPSGFVFTLRDQGDDLGDSDAGRNNGRTQTFTIANYVSNVSIDAGLIQAGSAVGHVGEDKNGDGTIDPGPGRPGIQVIVIDPRNGIVGDGDDVEMRRAVSDSNGNFSFVDLAPGQYAFRVNLPQGSIFLPPGLQSDIEHFCDGYGYTRIITIGPGGSFSFNVGLRPAPAAIEGIVWNDANGNKVRDGGLIRGTLPDIMLAIDISGSTSEPFAGTSVGDVNGDGYSNTILDAEIQAGISLTQQLIAAGYGNSAYIGIVIFNGIAANVDMNSVLANLQVGVAANSDADADGQLDVVKALKSLRSGGATNYEAALQQVISSFTALGTPNGQGNLLFLSDGIPTAGNGFDDEVLTLLAANVNLRAFGVGQAASLDQLRKIDPFAKIYQTGDELFAALNLNNATGYSRERGMANAFVYLDINNDGLWNSASEPRVATLEDDPDTSDIDEAGYYRFGNLAAGTYYVREFIPTGYTQTYPGTPLFKHTVTLNAGATRSGVDFGNAANPALAGIPITQTYTRGSAAILLAPVASVSDLDTPILFGGTLQIRVAANADATDLISIAAQGIGAGQIGVSGNTITYGGVAIASYSGGSGSAALLFTLNANATLAAVQALARRITFRNTIATPSTLTRTIEWRLTDGAGGTSALVNQTVAIV